MNLFLIPQEVCDSIEVQLIGFWWGHGQESRVIRWKTWDKMCVMNEAGGLGFRQFKNFNISTLAMQGWRLIINDNPLVSTCIRAKYISDRNFVAAKLGVNPNYK